MQASSEGAGNRGKHGTVLESVAEFREQYQRSKTQQADAVPAGIAGQIQTGDTVRYRSSNRSPIAALTVLDDGKDDGETIRIRQTPYVIGRSDGDLKIANDNQMSARHAELVRREQAGGWAWCLRDLGSTNGTFVCISSGLLHSGQIVFLGGARYLFEISAAAGALSQDLGTSKWQQPNRQNTVASLTELTSDGVGTKYPIQSAETVIGRDRSKCSIVLSDPMVNPCHARIARDARGRWSIQNLKSLNGVWLQIDEVPLGNGGYFQLGEQRFAVRIG